MKKTKKHDREALELVRALWIFIDNVTDDDPTRTDQFFALRERVRDFYPEPRK